MKIRYVRIARKVEFVKSHNGNNVLTNFQSWMTYKLPREMSVENQEIEQFVDEKLPGWQLVSGCGVNPDELVDTEEEAAEIAKEDNFIFPLNEDQEQ
jgi:hypothetical protein